MVDSRAHKSCSTNGVNVEAYVALWLANVPNFDDPSKVVAAPTLCPDIPHGPCRVVGPCLDGPTRLEYAIATYQFWIESTTQGFLALASKYNTALASNIAWHCLRILWRWCGTPLGRWLAFGKCM